MTTTNPPAVPLAAEQRRLIADVNDTAAAVPAGTVDALVLRTAERDPDRPAIVSHRGVVGYKALRDCVERLAGQLHGLGIGPGARLVLCTELGAEQVIGVLAAMRVGAVCLPVPPELPATARWEAAGRAKAAAVLTQWWQLGRIDWPEGVAVVAVEQEPGAATPTPPAAAAPDPAADPDAPAVLLTDPARRGDGVPLTHRDLLGALPAVNDRLGLRPGDRVLALNPAGSTLALHETLGALLAGATVVFGRDIDVHDPLAWLDRLAQDEVTAWLTTPTRLTRLVDRLVGEPGAPRPAALRAVLLAGERLHPALVADLDSALGRELAVGYAYPTVEPGALATWQDARAVATGATSVPIGRPLTNQRLYALGESLAPCPVWVTGRLHAGGYAVRWAGADRPAVPVADLPGAPGGTVPLVPTGLFGRLLPDGAVELTGDEDSRITVHGRPLNLRDTELALAGHPEVREAVVVPAGDGAAPVGYVRVRTGTAVTGPDLVDYLRRKVSPYLLPARVEVRADLPVTPDGRLDRAALRASAAAPVSAPEPGAPQPAAAHSAAPSATEQDLIDRVTAVACRLFDVSHIEPNVNLLDIGATSYQLVRLATVLEEELNLTVDVEELLRFPSIAVVVSGHLGRLPAPSTTDTRMPSTVNGGPAASTTDAPAEPALLTALTDRQAFKDAKHGLRHDLADRPGVALPAAAEPRIHARRTTRTFDPGPVGLPELATLLAAARIDGAGGEPKRWYPSAGGAYPIQAYLLAAPGRVRGLPGGSYYYHPARNALVAIDPAGSLPASAFADINRAAFRQSAFSLYLIARMPAIVPLYADLSWDFAVFEAGALTQLYSQVAAECGLGVCPVGTMDTAPLPALFGLAAGDRFVHALFGGRPEEA